MPRTGLWVRATLGVAILVLLSTSLASAQQLKIGFLDSARFELEPPLTSYTATHDLWEWSSKSSDTSVRSGEIISTLKFLETLQDIGDTVWQPWQPDDEVLMRHRMQVDLRQVKNKSQSTGPVRGHAVTVSGRAQGQLLFDLVGDEVVWLQANWDAKITGDGWCADGKCWITYEMTGKVSDADGQRNCGEVSIRAGSELDLTTQEWTFQEVSGLGHEVTIGLRVANDGTTCFSKNTGNSKATPLTGDFTFYHGGVPDTSYTLGTPERLRVMPGDNVTITRISYRDVPVRLLESLESIGDTLWDPNASPLEMTQNIQVEIQVTMEDLQLRGQANGVFPSGVVAEGWITGEGVCLDESCTIQLSQTLQLLDQQRSMRCGAMSSTVTVNYVSGTEPTWTFETDGAGSMMLRDHQRCLLESMEGIGDT